MTAPKRIAPNQARAHVEEAEALLVCAYEDEGACREKHLEGAISEAELAAQSHLGKDQELIFYCA